MEPKSSRNGPRRASKDPKNPPRRLLERLLAINVDPEDSKKACWRPRIAQEGLPEAKISPRSHFGAIVASILRAYFCTCSVPKSGPNSGPFLMSFLAESAQKAFDMAPEGPKKCQDELEDAIHQKI